MKLKNNLLVILSVTLSFLIVDHSKADQTIVVTIKPLHSLVSGVLGDTGSAELLVTGNESPHDFQLKPSQISSMQEAELLFYIDKRFETFLFEVSETLPNTVRQAAVVKNARLNLLSYREGGAWDAHHDHDEHGHDEHAHDDHDEHDEHKHDEHAHDDHDDHDEHKHDEHAHDDHDDHDGHDNHDEERHSEFDYHVWLSPKNSAKIVKFIAKELSALNPDLSKTYKQNAKMMMKRIKALDKTLHASLKPVMGKPYIVFHDAYQYFETTYGMTAVGSVTLEPHELPSPNRITEIREKLQQTNAECVFREPQFSDRLVTIVTEGTTAKSGTLDPLGADLTIGENLYFTLMTNLANNLKGCLS